MRKNKHMSKEEKRLIKLEKKMHDYINTRMNIESEYKKYNSISGKEMFSNENEHKRYLENLKKSINSIDDKISTIDKDIKILKVKLDKQ